MKKKALVTGITGQDGSYLAELLNEKGYEVYGLARRTSVDNRIRIESKVHFIEGDLADEHSVFSAIKQVKPDEVYNLGAMSNVGSSFKVPIETTKVTGLGALYVLESLRQIKPKAKFYQASTSELFGNSKLSKQNENTPFQPCSPYAVAKLFAHWTTINYREAFGMFACCGILFNHESPRRGLDFVTRKITNGFYKIAIGELDYIELGNLNSRRDWGHARDYVRGMWLMLQQDKPEEFVLATGETHTIKEFAERAGKYFGFNLIWKGKGLKEKGIDKNTGKVLIKVNKDFYRPTDVHSLCGDFSKAEKKLKWKKEFSFDDLIFDMCENELSLA